MQRGIRAAISIAAVLGVVALAGCSGGSGNDGAAEPTDGDGAVELTYMDADGTCASDPADGVEFDKANDLITSFQTPKEELLVTDPLPDAIPDGTTVAFLNNDTPVAGLMYSFMQEAATAAEVELVNVSTGTDAQSINTALNSVVEMKPDILIAQSLDATFWQDQLEELKEAGTAIVYANVNAEDFGLDDTIGGLGTTLVNGEVMGAGAVAFTCGTANEFVFYSIPELAFSPLELDATQKYLAEVCPDCNLRVVDISIADPSPADKIVSDLQAHPETQYFIAMADQFQIGLADKAALAGIENAHGFGQSSLPPNIQAIADGSESAGYPVDFSMYMWLLLDEGLRKQQDAFTPYTDWEEAARAMGRVLTEGNAADYVDGFVAYPDKEDDFKALWGR